MLRPSQVPLVVKNPPTSAGDAREVGSVHGSGRFPGEGNGTHTSILAWRIPWTEEPGRLQSIGSQGVRHDWGDLACSMHRKKITLTNKGETQKSKAGRGWRLFLFLFYRGQDKFYFILLLLFFSHIPLNVDLSFSREQYNIEKQEIGEFMVYRQLFL